MTNVEMLKEVIANETMSEAAREFAQEKLNKELEKAEKRRNQQAEKAAEDAPLVEAIMAVLTTEYQIAGVIKDAVNVKLGSEYNVQKVSRKLSTLAAAGTILVQDVKIPKKGPCKGYALAE